jgi:hypothetical protein
MAYAQRAGTATATDHWVVVSARLAHTMNRRLGNGRDRLPVGPPAPRNFRYEDAKDWNLVVFDLEIGGA